MVRFLILSATLVVAALFGNIEAKADAPSVVRIGFATIGVGGRQYSAYSTFAVAHVQGLVENELAPLGIKVEWQFFKGAGPAVNEAIAGEQLDFAVQGDLPSIVGRAAGLHTHIVLVGSTGTNAYVAVPAQSTLATLADLKGHTVADFKGTASELVASRILATAGLTERDLKLVNLEAGTTLAALATGQVDAGFTSLFAFGARDQGLIKLIYSTKGQSPPMTAMNTLLVADAFAQKYPDIVDRVVKVGVAAARWASDDANRAALYDVWAKCGLPAKSFAEEFDGTDLRIRNRPVPDEFLIARYKTALADALRFGLVRSDIDVDAWVDRGPYDRAVVTLGVADYWPRLDAEGRAAASN
jgi:sulfonate transport system substrate-binding protein